MTKEVLIKHNERMTKAIQALSRELSTIRAGRASASLLINFVDYYGAPTPINQIAGIATPEARFVTIQPYDKTALGDIEKAIQKSDLGISPSNDGT